VATEGLESPLFAEEAYDFIFEESIFDCENFGVTGYIDLLP
jgi:hypothetical protein